ncbi:cache domain-containing protein, partial [Paenibacillus sepulcri]|nr:cache domain-containing protein [Paenibacillus sepulcri]
MFRKLTTIIVISFVAFNALFLAGVSMMSYNIFFDFTSREVSEARLTLLNEDVKKVSNFNNSVSEAAIYIAVNRSVIETFSKDVEDTYDAIVEQRDLTEMVANMVSLKRSIQSIEIYTDRYKSYPRLQEGLVFPMEEIKKEPWFKLFDKMDNGWIPQRSSPSGQSVISYVHRLVSSWGKTVGYVKVDVSSDILFENIADDELYRHTEEPLLLLDAGGRVIARAHSPEGPGVLDAITVSKPSELYDMLDPEYEA